MRSAVAGAKYETRLTQDGMMMMVGDLKRHYLIVIGDLQQSSGWRNGYTCDGHARTYHLCIHVYIYHICIHMCTCILREALYVKIPIDVMFSTRKRSWTDIFFSHHLLQRGIFFSIFSLNKWKTKYTVSLHGSNASGPAILLLKKIWRYKRDCARRVNCEMAGKLWNGG